MSGKSVDSFIEDLEQSRFSESTIRAAIKRTEQGLKASKSSGGLFSNGKNWYNRNAPSEATEENVLYRLGQVMGAGQKINGGSASAAPNGQGNSTIFGPGDNEAQFNNPYTVSLLAGIQGVNGAFTDGS